MRLGFAKLGFAIVLGLVAWSGAAHADTPPSVWDRAKNPDLGDAFALHEAVQARLIVPSGMGPEGRRMADAQRGRVLAMLQAAGAETSKDPQLRFDLGETYAILHDYTRAATILQAALAELPTYSNADDAWSMLAEACGHTGNRACELKAWHEILQRQTEDFHRRTPTLNMAETDMHEGDLRSAIEGYKDAMAISARLPDTGDETAPLAVWGLAIALDRAGEIAEAERQALLAIALERSIGHVNLLHNGGYQPGDERVYFEPAYEVFWYDGLGAAASARVATTSRDRLFLWQQAVAAFEIYVRAGEPKHDRWLPIAKARLARFKIERDRVAKQVAKEPEPEPQVHLPEAGGLTL